MEKLKMQTTNVVDENIKKTQCYSFGECSYYRYITPLS